MPKRKVQNPNIRAIKLWHKLCPAYFPFMIIHWLFANLSPYFNIYLSAEIVNEIVGKRTVSTLITLVAITIGGNFLISIIGGMLSRGFKHQETLLNQKEADLFYQKTFTLDYEDLENTEVRQLRRKIAESAKIDAHGKQSLLINLNELSYCIINIVLSVYLFFEMIFLIISNEFDWLVVFFAILIILLILLNVWTSFIVKKNMAELSNEMSLSMIEENRIDDAIDCYNMGKDVRLYRQDKLIQKIQKYEFDLHKRSFRTYYTKSFWYHIPQTLFSIILQATVYLFICIYALKGVFGIGNIIKYVGFIQRIINAVIRMFNIGINIANNTPFVEDYLAFLDVKQKMAQGTRSLKEVCPNGSEYEIEFCDVSFRYPSSETFALQNISLKLKSGQRYAVVGMNGSGKTTFIKLLCRLYDPTEGAIKLNGVNIKSLDYNEYLAFFSVVFQDFKLFSFKLGQNVAAQSDYDKERVERCLKKAGFEERLAKMSDGTDTYLYRDFDENGVEISGGEAQKVALARALYKNAPFIVLDEPTSALDPIAEYDIYTKFNAIVENKTAIYISHRLASCRFCSEIIVFHEGKIIQQGSHKELIEEEMGKYYELWNAQAQYYNL